MNSMKNKEKDMKIYESKTEYILKKETPAEDRIDSPEKIVHYMDDSFEKHPYQESVWVIAVNRKVKPICKSMKQI